MVISYKWLNELINFSMTPQDLAEVLTSVGLEVETVEAYESVKGGLHGVVTGKVVSVTQHPNADKLKLTRVEVGTGELLPIVCGAPNVAEGQKVLVATIGTTLYPFSGEPLQIKKAKIRGEESMGMICAADEIGIGEDHAGIMVLPPDTPVGIPAASFFQLYSDHLIHIGLTPNRSDAYSHWGVARDLHAVLKTGYTDQVSLTMPERINLSQHAPASVQVEISDPAVCKRYSGITIGQLQVGPSPDWLKQRLQALGIRSINNVVDVTNYVMLETGQPLHAFDLAKLSGKVRVGKASVGSRFLALDGKEYQLNLGETVIADDQGPLCLAGVFGGLNSGVSDQTQSVFLESAAFDPTAVRICSLNHQLRTESAQRFEKGTDPGATIVALERAAFLLTQVANAREISAPVDVQTEGWQPLNIELDVDRVGKLLGVQIPTALIRKILELLDFQIREIQPNLWDLSPPAAKTDVTREADVIEEIARIYGYNRISFPGKFTFELDYATANPGKSNSALAALLTGAGYREILTNSVGKSSWYGSNPPENLVKLLNSQTSELDILRADLLHSGLEVVAHNLNHRNGAVKLFEMGRCYATEGNQAYREEEILSLFLSGQTVPPNWLGTAREADFFELKTVFINLLNKLGVSAISGSETKEWPWLYALTVQHNHQIIGHCGKVDEKLLSRFNIQEKVFYAAINLSAIRASEPRQGVSFKEVGRFPVVRRDLSVLFSEEVPFSELEKMARKECKGLLKEVSLLDVYEGKNLNPGQKSFTFSFNFKEETRTLRDEEVDQCMGKIIQQVEQVWGGMVRKS